MRITTVTLTALLLAPLAVLAAAAPAPVEFTVKLETVMKHDDGKFLWFHPRAAAIPSRTGGEPTVVMTIQKHLKISDYYSGLHVMMRKSPTAPWTGPTLPPELDWRQQSDGVTISVADVTPGWHAPTGKLLAIGCQVRYSPQGKQLDDVKRAHQTVYAIFDPKTERWTPWQVLELPDDEQFNFARNACAQWLVKPDGTLLVPLYIGRSAKDRYSTTVSECRFDGAKLTFVRNGNVLRLDVARGFYEPSLIAFHGRYFLTLRNDVRGYVSVSEDGLQFAAPQPWLFDDGAELGSYNTQQHWLAHSDGLFLIYTRRGANNDHIVRHRAPLFMAQVSPTTLRVMRATEKVVVPERGAEMGNFGACAISERESWVTVSEGMFMKDSKQRGAEGATFVARVLWSKPNKLRPAGAATSAPVR
ncbi:MAG: exo-alpha-sialidase [Verrucomicrobia bacterium]|nr:exo-alpha-sialidase [Verrucomicrobiota bacterium]